MIAFERFKEIENLGDEVLKQKAWLEDYKGINHCSAEFEKHKWLWVKDRKPYQSFSAAINLIGRLPNRTIIEFDGDPVEAKKYLDITEQRLKEKGWGYIRSSHKGKSDYLWVEFIRPMQDLEVKKFLMWVAPDGSEVDINFASSKKIFQVMYALHWRHSSERELPIFFNEGEKIDFDSLNIKSIKGKNILKTSGDFKYNSFFKASQIFKPEGQAKKFNEIQPLFFDKHGLWWLWNSNEFKWEIVDEVDILNMIGDATGEDIISPKNRTIILNSLKQEGRKRTPKPIEKTWIQFKDTIVDIITGKRFAATSEYFVTNPIPWALHSDNIEATPVMDRIFEEWVGKEYSKTLYEIISYSLLPDYPINRLFCFIGAGMNGKSKYLELLKNFIGCENCCTTELDTLLQSRFEITRLHKKLVCMMGETNFNEMSKTSILKKLTGGDLIGFEYKNKNPFDETNYAKIIIATNNLPTTTDKTMGFYRRWMIIDFPNSFSEAKDILSDIPKEEYSALALKCCAILKDVLKNRKFTHEGSVEDRMERYESKSNFLDKFIKEATIEDLDGYITKADFFKKFSEWSKEHKHRELSETSVGLAMKKIGVEQERRYFNWLFDGKGGQLRVYVGIKWKD
jgi:P4 family phage/plasmid primase-like protien